MLPLIPIISLASSLVPDILGLFGGKRAGEVAGQVANVVQQIAGTSNLEDAAKAVLADGAKAAELKVKLEEIKQHFVELQFQDAKDERASLLEALKAEIAERDNARGSMLSAVSAQGWAAKTVAMGPPVVSAIVLLGFFIFTIWLVAHPSTAATPRDEITATLLNVVVGALVAGFTAVLNFWLGSSQGSRDKDKTVAVLQQAQSVQATETVRQIREATTQTLNDTVSLTAARTGAAPGAAAAPAAPVMFAGPVPGVPSRFDLCLPIVLQKEGGFSNDPDDNGGATMMGITIGTLAAWRRKPVTQEDVRALTKDEAQEIYRANYWNVIQCDRLPKGVDLMMFDAAVNMGPGGAVKLLQGVIGTKPDGGMGPFTLKATLATDARALVEALGKARLAFYQELDDFPKFGKGWSRRVEEIRGQALLMLAG